MGSFKLALFFLGLAAPNLAAEAQKPAAEIFSFSGYLKDIWRHSSSALDGRPYSLNTSRARLSLEGEASEFRAMSTTTMKSSREAILESKKISSLA